MVWDHSKLKLNEISIFTAVCEIPENIYKPPFDLAGKTVLDIGATCGEVAYWFIQQHHAKKVICIENDPTALPFLVYNAKLMNIEVVPEAFSLEHLHKYKVDFIKSDCEGYEMILLEYVKQGGVLPPTVLEAHTNWIKDQFFKAGFKVTKITNDTRNKVAVYMMTNYQSLGFGV